MSKHTPGPWKARGTGEKKGIRSCTYWEFDILNAKGGGLFIGRAYGSFKDEAKANAKLIARAPEMEAEIDLLKGERDHFEKFYNEYHEELPKMSAELGDNKRLKSDLVAANARVEELEGNQIPGRCIACEYLTNNPPDKNTTPICKAGQCFTRANGFCHKFRSL